MDYFAHSSFYDSTWKPSMAIVKIEGHFRFQSEKTSANKGQKSDYFPCGNVLEGGHRSTL